MNFVGFLGLFESFKIKDTPQKTQVYSQPPSRQSQNINYNLQ